MLAGTRSAAAEIREGSTRARSTIRLPPKEMPECKIGAFWPSKPRPRITSAAHLPISCFSGFKNAGSLLLPAGTKHEWEVNRGSVQNANGIKSKNVWRFYRFYKPCITMLTLTRYICNVHSIFENKWSIEFQHKGSWGCGALPQEEWSSISWTSY